jgi:hypothetical protein
MGTYDRSLEILSVLRQLLHRICLISRSLDDCASVLSANVFQNAPQLSLSRSCFRDLELEFWSAGMGLFGVVTGLIFSGVLGGIGGGLFQEGVDSHGSWQACLVEESNHIEGFVLNWV